MNVGIIQSINSRINQLISLYHSVLKINSLTPKLKLANCFRDTCTGEVKFKVQITGKSLFPILTIKDFIKNNSLLNEFCAIDKEIISAYLSTEFNTDPIYKIIARNYDRSLKKFTYTIKYNPQGNYPSKLITVGDLSKLIKHLHLFDDEDAFIIKNETSALVEI